MVFVLHFNVCITCCYRTVFISVMWHLWTDVRKIWPMYFMKALPPVCYCGICAVFVWRIISAPLITLPVVWDFYAGWTPILRRVVAQVAFDSVPVSFMDVWRMTFAAYISNTCLSAQLWQDLQSFIGMRLVNCPFFHGWSAIRGKTCLCGVHI